MQFFPVFIILGIMVLLFFVAKRRVFPELVRKKAMSQLEELLFSGGYWQKSDVLSTFRTMTGSRFSEKEILDYFFKIKGLHTIKINSNTNFWLKKYLFSPTIIKLNYFEQVKFYETFLNYPTTTHDNRQMILNPERKSRSSVPNNYQFLEKELIKK